MINNSLLKSPWVSLQLDKSNYYCGYSKLSNTVDEFLERFINHMCQHLPILLGYCPTVYSSCAWSLNLSGAVDKKFIVGCIPFLPR